jgi:Heliorhodopsin
MSSFEPLHDESLDSEDSDSDVARVTDEYIPDYPDPREETCGCCCGCLRFQTVPWARKVLRTWHIVAAALQGASFIALCILFGIYYEEQLKATVTGYAGRGQQRVLYTYQPAWLILAFTLLTVISHIVQAVRALSKTTLDMLEYGKGTNWIRWYEYAVTASLMTIVIAQSSTVQDLLLLILLAVMNVVMQLLGGLHEERHRGALWSYFRSKKAPNEVREKHLPTQSRQWLFHVLAWVLFAASWAVIAWYFIAAATTLCKGETLPWFVWAVFFTLLVQYLLFGIVQLVGSKAEMDAMRDQLKALKNDTDTNYHTDVGTGYPKKKGLWAKLGDRRVNELLYIFLSLFAKISLEWIVFAGLVDFAVSGAAQRDFTKPCHTTPIPPPCVPSPMPSPSKIV